MHNRPPWYFGFHSHGMYCKLCNTHKGYNLILLKNEVIRSSLASADIIVSVAPRGLDNDTIEKLLKYDAFSQKQSVLASVYRSKFSLPNELREGSTNLYVLLCLTVPVYAEAKHSLEIARNHIMKCITSNLTTPIGTDDSLAKRHNFFTNIARRFCILPIKMLDYEEARIKVSYL